MNKTKTIGEALENINKRLKENWSKPERELESDLSTQEYKDIPIRSRLYL